VNKLGIFLVPGMVVAALTGCNGKVADTATKLSGKNTKKSEGSVDTESQIESEIQTQTDPKNPKVVGPTCVDGDSNTLCLALKYVVYDDSTGKPVVSQDDAVKVVQQINQAFSQCNIAFQMEEYVAANPADYKLDFNTSNQSDLDNIRKAFMNDSTLLVTTTGKWDRSGSLGNTGANAWTAMPGEGTYGAILEDSVGTFGLIIAHGLGHYLNLDHVSDEADLMNPVIYDSSTRLDPSQCETARSAANSYWNNMLR